MKNLWNIDRGIEIRVIEGANFFFVNNFFLKPDVTSVREGEGVVKTQNLSNIDMDIKIRVCADANSDLLSDFFYGHEITLFNSERICGGVQRSDSNIYKTIWVPKSWLLEM